MKRAITLFATILFLVPVSVCAESIDLFQSQIHLREDGSLDVTEWITYDFEENERHGIFRTIPLTHPSGDPDLFHERSIDIKVGNVLLDQAAVPFEVSEEGREIEIKIGDPDSTITGTHVYELNYHVHGALQYLEDGAVDLNWNVTGNGWEVPIKSVTTRVPDPESVYLDAIACYQGAEGSTLPCQTATSTAFVDFYAENLLPGEGLTIARAVDPEKVARMELVRLNTVPFVLVFIAVWFMGLGVFIYREFTKHRSGRTIIPEYEPYKGVRPMYTGLLFDGALDPHDITAGIVDLAAAGFLSIKKIDRTTFLLFTIDDYALTLKRPIGEATGQFEAEILKLIFEEEAVVGTTVTLAELASSPAKKTKNTQRVMALTAAAAKDLMANGYFENNWKRIAIVGALAFIVSLILFIFISVFALIFFVVTCIALIFGVKRRTRKGYEALDHLKGFKLFLSVTDKERFAFHNAPEKSPEQFMEYLPYAIAFRVEKKWAKAFEGITIPNPDWYQGSAGSFSAVSLTNSLGAFSTAFASSSGTSASSGGGSSGGGAGGGGGGSW